MQTPQQFVASLYLAYFGRPGEPAGIAYWTDQLAYGMTLDAVAETFSRASEAALRFGGLTPEQQITNIYQQLLGREPEPTGAAYWLGEVNAGRINPAQMALNIYNGALGADAVVVGARQDVADQFTVLLGANDTTYNGPSDTNIARLIIQSTNGTTPPADAAALAALGVKLVAVLV